MSKTTTSNLTKYQIYLTPELEEAFDKYLAANFTKKDRVLTAVFRRAIADFLEKEGFYEKPAEVPENISESEG